ncbi:MAG: ankyrin repeat domain-containing protein [Acidobacteriota bacterium]
MLLFCGAFGAGVHAFAQAPREEKSASSRAFPSPAEMAAYQGDTEEVLRLLNAGFDVNHKGEDGLTLLIYAVEGKHPSLVKLLLAKGADPNAANSGAVASAAMQGRIDMLRTLLAAGGMVNVHVGAMSDTPLMFACQARSLSCVKLLLEKGADVNGRNALGRTPIMAAGRAISQILIEHGADINAKDRQGITTLMFVTMLGDVGGVSFLLKEGADPTLADWKGWTAEDYAIQARSEEIVKLLQEAVARWNGKK